MKVFVVHRTLGRIQSRLQIPVGSIPDSPDGRKAFAAAILTSLGAGWGKTDKTSVWFFSHGHVE